MRLNQPHSFKTIKLSHSIAGNVNKPPLKRLSVAQHGAAAAAAAAGPPSSAASRRLDVDKASTSPGPPVIVTKSPAVQVRPLS